MSRLWTSTIWNDGYEKFEYELSKLCKVWIWYVKYELSPYEKLQYEKSQYEKSNMKRRITIE